MSLNFLDLQRYFAEKMLLLVCVFHVLFSLTFDLYSRMIKLCILLH